MYAGDRSIWIVVGNYETRYKYLRGGGLSFNAFPELVLNHIYCVYLGTHLVGE
jgi:hypothetical protein